MAGSSFCCYSLTMRFLGVDYGTKKIGIALSDKSAKFAFPHSIIKFTRPGLVNSEIKKICRENEVEKIILGKPGGYKGDAQKILGKIEKFKKELEKNTGLSVVYESEVLTTKQAERPYGGEKTGRPVSNKKKTAKKPAKDMDASAAALILQSWLDSA